MTTRRKKAKKKERSYGSATARAEASSGGFDRPSLKIGDLNMFRVKAAGVKRLDIIPYVVGKGNPHADEGVVYYERTYFTHRGVGAEQETYVCPKKTISERCPICEYRAKAARDPDTDEQLLKDLKPKVRQLYLVVDQGEPEKGTQLMEISHYLFGKELDSAILSDEEYDTFFRADGYSLRTNWKEDGFAGTTFCTCNRVDFKRRKTPLAESLIDEAPCLDDLIVHTPYDELRKVFLEVDGEAEKDDDGTSVIDDDSSVLEEGEAPWDDGSEVEEPVAEPEPVAKKKTAKKKPPKNTKKDKVAEEVAMAAVVDPEDEEDWGVDDEEEEGTPTKVADTVGEDENDKNWDQWDDDEE